MESAPFYDDIADGPAGGSAHWLTASDGCRIRIGHWPAAADSPARGTVLLFPGRTEYIEKYGRAAADLAARGYATLAIDWRGQGLADRLLSDRRIGHVGRFTDYQKDVAAMVRAAEALDLPRPFHLLAHSMGGCIGLRALMERLPVASCAFTGPMWGIYIAPTTRPAAWVLSWSGARLGLGHHLAPGTKAETYVSTEPFADNTLTRDAEMFAYMQRQLAEYPDLALGGPSLRWLNEALRETARLARRAAPALPCVTFLGTNERIVDVPRIEARMAHWPQGALVPVQGGEHEVMMDTPETRKAVFDRMTAHFDAHAEATPPRQSA